MYNSGCTMYERTSRPTYDSVFDLLIKGDEGVLKLSGEGCDVRVRTRGGYVFGASINGREVLHEIELIGALISILKWGNVKVEFENAPINAEKPIILNDLLVLYVAKVLDEMDYYTNELPPEDALLKVIALPENPSDIHGRFVRYLAKRFGVGMWFPIRRVPLSSCFSSDFVRYAVMMALREYPDLLEITESTPRRYDMQGKLQELLKRLVEDSPDIIGVVVATMDGLPISHYSSYAYDPEIQAAISSAIVTLSESSVRDADLGNTSEILIVADKGKVFMYPLGDLVLGVLADKDANTGMIFMKVRKALDDIQSAALKEIEIGE